MKKTIGIIGFGSFGRLIHAHLSPYFDISVYDEYQPVDNTTTIEEVASSDVIILSIPCKEFENVLKKISPIMNINAIVVDVCSVKVYPVQKMMEYLPDTVSILATHPLFGPQSLKEEGNKISISQIRGSTNWVILFLRHVLKMNIIYATPESHDKEMAVTQALVHWLAKSFPNDNGDVFTMTTQSYKSLADGFALVKNDSREVYETIECYNPFAKTARENLLFSLMRDNEILSLDISKSSSK